jgi:mannose-1-phosphate guanylyltransferase
MSLSKTAESFLTSLSIIEAENAALKAQLAQAAKVISALKELMEALEVFEQLAEAPTLTMFVTPKAQTAKYGKRRTEEEIDTFCSEYQVEHLKPDAIAAKHGVCAQTVRAHLSRRGIYHSRQEMALAEREP